MNTTLRYQGITATISTHDGERHTVSVTCGGLPVIRKIVLTADTDALAELVAQDMLDAPHYLPHAS